MLAVADLLTLPYDHTLTQAGIEYAKKSLHYTYNRMHLSPAARLRKIVAGVAVELALRRWLDAEQVPYDLLGATAFTDKDRYDLNLGGRRCDLKSCFLNHRPQIQALNRNPGWLLDASALVPDDQFRSEALGEQDLYLFGFLTGFETRHSTEVQSALTRGQPLYLLYTLAAPHWRGQAPWRSLGQLILKTDAAEPVAVEVGGQGADRAALSERLVLSPGARVVTQTEFYSLLYVHTPRLLTAQVGVRSPALGETRVIAPLDWFNIWVYGQRVWIAGWLTKAEFRAHSALLPEGARVKQYAQTQTPNRAMLIRDLRPIGELVTLVKRAGKRA
jgi:hypothetical protein